MALSSLKSLWRRYQRSKALWFRNEARFQWLAENSEKLARNERAAIARNDFELMVAQALDRLPEEFQRALEDVPVVVSDRGWEVHAYGLYEGDGIARDGWADRIIIFQDTLERDYGHDRARLGREIERTVRHEIAHHLGWDERGVRALGL